MAKTQAETIRDAREADRLLKDETLMRVFAEVERDIFSAFASSHIGDVDELLALQAELAGVTKLRTRLKIWVDAGNIAEKRKN